MYVSMVVNVLNIIGNYTLIFGKFGMPALGVEGAAISTSVCRLASAVILMIVLFRKHIPSFPKELFRPFPWLELKNLLKIGIPSAGEHILPCYLGNYRNVDDLCSRREHPRLHFRPPLEQLQMGRQRLPEVIRLI